MNFILIHIGLLELSSTTEYTHAYARARVYAHICVCAFILYIYCLYNNAVSISDYVASDSKIWNWK
jgi:hypothetical protein